MFENETDTWLGCNVAGLWYLIQEKYHFVRAVQKKTEVTIEVKILEVCVTNL